MILILRASACVVRGWTFHMSGMVHSDSPIGSGDRILVIERHQFYIDSHTSSFPFWDDAHQYKTLGYGMSRDPVSCNWGKS